MQGATSGQYAERTTFEKYGKGASVNPAASAGAPRLSLMEWLFVLGVTFDIAGAALVAWAIVARPPVENREEALTKFGANFWIVLFREREQAQVRVGLAVLGFGFLLQLIAYVVKFSWPKSGIAVVVAVAVLGGTFLVGRRLARLPIPQLVRQPVDHVIGDERHLYGVATLEDVVAWRRLYADRLYGRPLQRRLHIVRPQISSGNWIFRCPDCGPGYVNPATPGLPTVVCSTCSGEFPAHFPDRRIEIENSLLEIPNPEQRTWP
jgi:hypothetical protein